MTRFLASLILALALVFTTACGETKTETKPMAAAVSDTKAEALSMLQAQFDTLNNRGSGSVLLAAQMNDTVNGFCVQYAQFLDYTNLVNSYNSSVGNKETDFFSALEAKIKEKGRELAGVGYQQMQAGKSLACDGNDQETKIVETMASFMDTYGKPEGVQGDYDPQVVRSAWLRAAKIEASALMVAMKEPYEEDWGGPTADLGMLIETAEDRAFTAADLGVPAALAKKAKSWPRG